MRKVKRWLRSVTPVLVTAGITWLLVRLGVDPALIPPVVVEAPQDARAALTEPAEEIHFCGRHETLRDFLNAAPWPVKRITWTVDSSGYSGPLKREQIKLAFEVAWKSWAQGLDIDPVYVESEAGALVVSRFGPLRDDAGRIDGPGNILAWSELANGTKTQKKQLYDRAESWAVSDQPTQSQIDMVRVAAHEIGHVLGLVHDERSSGALMAPVYSLRVRLPTPRDIDRAVSLGYRRRAAVPTDPPPTISVPVNAEAVIKVLREAGYKVELVKP